MPVYLRRWCKPITACLYVWLIMPSIMIANGVEMLIGELDDPSWEVRRDAARQLGALQWGDLPPDTVVIEALAAALLDKEAGVRHAAATALGRISSACERVVPLLVKALADRVGAESEAATKALGQLGPDAMKAVPALVGVLTNHAESSSLRATAVEALGCMGPAASAAIPELIGVVADYRNRSGLRQAAAKALGSMGPAASCAIPVLSQVLADYNNSSALRQAATAALGQVRSPGEDSVQVLGLPRLDLTPLQLAGTTVVPLRALAEWLGATVAFDPITRTVTTRGRVRSITMRIGAATASVDGRDVPLPVPVFVFQNATMVPLRFLAECLDTLVDWHAATQEVILSTAGKRARLKVCPTAPEIQHALLEAAGLTDLEPEKDD